MEVEKDGVGPGLEPACFELTLDRGERIVEIRHEYAAHRIDHEHIHAVRRLEQPRALARRTLREVDGAQQTVMPFDKHERLALVPHVIARGDDVGACVEQLGHDRFGDAEAARRILAVHHHEVGAVALAQFGQSLEHGHTPRAADHIA